jgi:hypothetical protein
MMLAAMASRVSSSSTRTSSRRESFEYAARRASRIWATCLPVSCISDLQLPGTKITPESGVNIALSAAPARLQKRPTVMSRRHKHLFIVTAIA